MLPKTYNPKEHESKVYQKWEESGAFELDESKIDNNKKPYVIMLPPPNITGTLHMGHALQDTIMDILIRYHRMKGDSTVWIPGTDSAAIATNRVIVDQLKEEGKSRHDIGRKEFLNRVDKWYEKTGSEIIEQMKKLGATCDWNRLRFTMDDEYIEAVNHAFIEYYEKGYIYRGNRIINWDPEAQTTVSELEIERKTEKAPFYTFKYGPFEISTARPETKFGDKYVVMHPDDKRYSKYKHGDTFDAEWINGPITTTVIKDEAVDAKFGTGVMTITPWHDVTDFEIAERHDLDKEQIIGFDGKLLDIAGEFTGQSISEARPKIVEKLKEKELLVNVDEDYEHNLALNDRGKGILEPQIMEQWFVDMNKLKPKAIEAVEKGDVNFVPGRWNKHFQTWMENVHDWNISRQIWLGHRIPAWFKEAEQGVRISFIRHGQSQANVDSVGAGHYDSPLTDIGRREAEELATELDFKDVDIVLCSPLSRASDTANILFKISGQKIIQDDRLREIDFGDLTMKPSDQIKPFRTSGFPGGENYEQMRNRVTEVLSEIIDNYDGQHIAIVGHAGTFRVLEAILGDKKLSDAIHSSPEHRGPYHYQLKSLHQVGATSPGDDWKQDEDVLDTWFATALWSFAPLGWPNETADLKKLHPTSVLVTARDILHLWVARMVFSSLEFLDEVPFKDVFIHPTVLAKDGRRMSKSLGTGTDPLKLINEYGADATRFGLIYQMAFDSQAIKFDETDVVSGRNFANKIWNLARLLDSMPKQENTTVADKWILQKIDETAELVTNHIESYKIGEALHALHDFIWNDFADWYVEITKEQGSTEVAENVFQQLLILLHPFMPHLTEVIWQNTQDSPLINHTWVATTESKVKNEEVTRSMERFQDLVSTIRRVRAMLDISPAVNIDVLFEGEHELGAPLQSMTKTTIINDETESMKSFPLLSGGQIKLGSDAITNKTIEMAIQKLEKEQENLSNFIEKQKNVLAKMQGKAPQEAINEKSQTLAEIEGQIAEIDQSIKALQEK